MKYSRIWIVILVIHFIILLPSVLFALDNKLDFGLMTKGSSTFNDLPEIPVVFDVLKSFIQAWLWINLIYGFISIIVMIVLFLITIVVLKQDYIEGGFRKNTAILVIILCLINLLALVCAMPACFGTS